MADAILQRRLSGMGAVLIEGPKWCGKTTTAEQHARSVIYMDDPKTKAANINAVTMDPDLILNGAVPRLIDEWQIAPQLWDAVRFTVDHRDADGQFILTGSAVPNLSEEETERTHSGTGRISRIRMRTMSLWESGDSTGEVSLEALFGGGKPSATCSVGLEQIARLTCRGGWPRAVGQPLDSALDRAFDYYDAVVNYDVNRVDRSIRNPERISRLMRSYARFQGSQTPVSAICSDMSANENDSIDSRTVQAYLDALRLIFVIEDMPAWNPNLRSKAAIRSSSTRYFVDPSIATAALGLGPADLMADLNTFGFMFETLCARDLRVYADALDGKVYHYRDSKNLECDAVMHLRNGNYGLIEIKLGGHNLIDAGAANLIKLSNIIDTGRMKAPTFKMVLTAVGPYAYERPDGVFVVPVSTLRP